MSQTLLERLEKELPTVGENEYAWCSVRGDDLREIVRLLSQPLPQAGVALSDVEIGEAWGSVSTHDDHDTFRAGVRYAERAHGIGEKT